MAAPNVCSKTMNISAFISVVAGLGLFIIGIKGIAGNMGQLARRSVRDWLARLTNSYLSSAAVGTLTGALTQSTNAVTVILMSLYKADLITVPQARPVLVWANVGTMALVFAAAVDTHLFVLSIICVAGLCFYLDLDRSARWRPTVSALFSFALLFLGLELMRQGSHDIRSSEWVGQFLAYSAQWTLLGFVVGIVLALATQSSATVTVIAMAMASAGLMTLEGAMMTLYGASVGSGVSTYFIATSMKGKARQLAILQVMVKALGVAVLLPLFVIEHYFGQPLLAHAITAMTADPSLQIAIVYAVIQFVSVLAQEALNRPLWPLIVVLSPPSAEDALSTPTVARGRAFKQSRISPITSNGAAHEARSMAGGGGRYLGPAADDLRLRRAHAGGPALRGRSLHHRCLLVQRGPHAVRSGRLIEVGGRDAWEFFNEALMSRRCLLIATSASASIA
jgi:phosphate:Na+ symporter